MSFAATDHDGRTERSANGGDRRNARSPRGTEGGVRTPLLPPRTKKGPPSNRRFVPFAAPVVAAILAALAFSWLRRTCREREDLLRSMPLLKFQPDKYQGARMRSRYFEGWYYKFATSLDDDDDDASPRATSMAVVPGIFRGNSSDSDESHAFVFVVLDGERQHYYRFPTADFSYASGAEEYYVKVGGNRFSHSGASLDLRPREGDDADLVLRGELTFLNATPWPVSLTGLGAMGPVGWIPGLECSHAVLSFDHVLRGSLTMTTGAGGGEEEASASSSLPTTTISFDGGRGYTEKDYGRSFPSLWVWIQSNSFQKNPGTSLFVSVARVPLFGMGLPGFTAAVRHDGALIPFATWSGAKFEELRVTDEEVRVVVRSNDWWWGDGHRAEITVDRRDVPRALLYAPVNFTEMAPFVEEALRAKVHLRLFNGSGDVILDDVGENTGLEVHGNVQWLVDNICGKETAGRIICL